MHSSPNIFRVTKSRIMRWVRLVARMWARRGTYRVLVWKPEVKRPLERPRRRWKDNMKMYLREVGWEHGLDRSYSGYGQAAVCCESGNEPSGSIKCGEFLD